jgi:hypothetical protein
MTFTLPSVAESDAEDAMIDAAIQAAINAACLVIQTRLGVTTGDYASHWWSGADVEYHGELLGLAKMLRRYAQDEKKAQINDDGAEGALTYALAALDRSPGPIAEKAKVSADMLRAILNQRGTERFAYVPETLDKDGTIHIKPEGAKRLTDLIDVIVRG